MQLKLRVGCQARVEDSEAAVGGEMVCDFGRVGLLGEDAEVEGFCAAEEEEGVER
jgi:hypothetical protein